MDKIKNFFNEKASTWDSESIPNAEKIMHILESSELLESSKILDVACGTGVLEPFLLKFNPKKIVGIDISDKMIDIAKSKLQDERVDFICDNLFNLKEKDFEYIIIYNAFPHFLEPLKTIKFLHSLLKENGKFVICHGMNRKDLNSHHKKVANEISLGLSPAIDNAIMLKEYFNIRYLVDKKDIYIIYGVKSNNILE